jgi:hypothetical protein
VIAAVLTMVGVFVAASVPPFGVEVGLWAAAFWALTSADMYLQANQPNTEVFQNLGLTWAFALLLRLPAARRAVGRALSIGALFALASLYKQVSIATAVMLTSAYVLFAVRGGLPLRRALLHATAMLGPIAVGWLAVAGYFALTDRFAHFYAAVILFNRQYAGSSAVNAFLGFTPSWLMQPVMFPLLPLIVPIVLGATTGRELASARGGLLAAYAIGTVVAVALPGRFFEHYYQLWLPVVAIGGAWGLLALVPASVEPQRWLARAGMVIAVVLLTQQLPYYRLAPQEWSIQKYGRRMVNSDAVASLINQVLLPNETFYEWGHEAELYFYSRRRPPGSEFRSEHLLSGPREQERSRKLVADLASNAPELLLVSDHFRFPLQHPVPQWLMQHYAELAPAAANPWRAHGFRAYCRRGGHLEGRLLELQRQTASLSAPDPS